MEETKLRSILGLVSYELNDNLTRKDLIEDKNADSLVQQAITKLTKDERLYQFFLNDDETIRLTYCHRSGICLKHVMSTTYSSSLSKTYLPTQVQRITKEQFLADLSVRLSKLAAELGVGIVTIGHTNDDGQVKYCRMIEQRASVVVDLQRDKMSEDRRRTQPNY